MTGSSGWRFDDVAAWRLVVAAASVFAVLVVGWPLGPQVATCVLACTGLPALVWAALAVRVRPLLVVGTVLVLAIAAVHLALPGRPGDRSWELALPILSLYGVGEVAIVLLAWLWWRPLGGRSRVRRTVVAVVIVFAAVSVLSTGAVIAVGTTTPGEAELLPLPDPLALVGRTQTHCVELEGGRYCERAFLVSGPPGLSQEQVVARLREHLARDKGWGPTVHDGSCQPMSRNNRDGTLRICVNLAASADRGIAACPADVLVVIGAHDEPPGELGVPLDLVGPGPGCLGQR